jgi:hypothetical protein
MNQEFTRSVYVNYGNNLELKLKAAINKTTNYYMNIYITTEITDIETVIDLCIERYFSKNETGIKTNCRETNKSGKIKLNRILTGSHLHC